MSADIAATLNADNAAHPAPLFVINLCASTSPMALTHPNTPELKRYTFFVSRQREEGRERFRLHMGYFASQEEAESLLAAVRDVYPAAWAGPAPTSGVPRRARAVTALPMVTIATQPATVHATEPAAARPPAVAPVVAPVVVPAAVPVVPVSAAPAVAPPRAAPVPAPRPATMPAAAKETPVLEAMSNVRNVLAQLDGQRPAPPVAAPAVAVRPGAVAPVLKPAAPAVPAAPAAQAAPPAQAAPVAAAGVRTVSSPAIPAAPAGAAPRKDAKELDASQTLQVLEAATPVASVAMEDELPYAPDVRIVTPEDTQTLRDINLDAENNAPPCFAVQLVWAVTPIDVASLPHLAIFDAYTLYNVEGSRQGRKWYGLRLGFFSDPNSATQVAHYVRSDYQAVAVVPVAIKERDNARGGANAPMVAARLGEAGSPQKPQDDVPLQAAGLDGFELLKDDRPAPAKRDVDDMGSRAAPRAPAPAPAQAAAPAPKLARDRIAAAAAANLAAKPGLKPAGKPTGKRVVVRKRPEPSRAAPGAPQPLESTLEILGASTLSLDKNSREIVNDSAIREPIEKKQASRFSKLLNRLSGG